MNNNFYTNDLYKRQNQNPTLVPEQGTTPSQNIGLPVNGNPIPLNGHPEYADNIFLLNIGKKVTVYFSYPDSIEWRDKIFSGTIIDAGRDYLLLKDSEGKNILLWAIYINYAIFDEDIIHNYNIAN